MFLDYQQQTSRSIIVQCDLEKKNRIQECQEKKPMSYLQTFLNQVRTYKKILINLSTAKYNNALDFVNVV